MIDLEKIIEKGLKEERKNQEADKRIVELEKIKADAQAEIDEIVRSRSSASLFRPQWEADLIREVRAMIEARKGEA